MFFNETQRHEDTKVFNDNPNLNPNRTPSLNREGWGGSFLSGRAGVGLLLWVSFLTLHRKVLANKILTTIVKPFKTSNKS